MTDFRVRIGEADRAQPTLYWDTIWDKSQGKADWALYDASETQNIGGLSARAALHSAIVIMLFTDKRIPDSHPHKKFVADDDPRGWWGDDIDVREDLNEGELGSLIWVYQRAPLTEEVRRYIEVAATEALYPLIKQGAASRINVSAVAFPEFNRIELSVDVFGRDGKSEYSLKFEDLWKQVASR